MESFGLYFFWIVATGCIQWRIANWFLLAKQPLFGRNHLWQEALDHFLNPVLLVFWIFFLIFVFPLFSIEVLKQVTQWCYRSDVWFIDRYIGKFCQDLSQGAFLAGYLPATILSASNAYLALYSPYKGFIRGRRNWNPRIKWKFFAFALGHCMILSPVVILVILIFLDSGVWRNMNSTQRNSNSKLAHRKENSGIRKPAAVVEFGVVFPVAEPRKFKRLPF